VAPPHESARAVWQLAQHYRRRPDQLQEEELRQYFLYLTNEKQIARPTATIALWGIKFFYEQTLKQEWPTLRFVRPQPEHKLPVVLSRAEVRQILARVQLPVYRACLTPSMPAACACWRARACKCPMSTVPGCCCTFTARTNRIATYPCPSRLCNCCALAHAPLTTMALSGAHPARSGAQSGP
jgi:hypothetical protein